MLALAFPGLDLRAQERLVVDAAPTARTNFKVGQLSIGYVGANGQGSIRVADAKPLSLATADFNHDGYPDLIAGYSSAGGGLLAVHLANPEAFAPRLPESLSSIRRGEFPQPFLASAVLIPVNARPDILAAGDFNGDGNPDVLFATLGEDRFFIAAGDGKGRFRAPRAVTVSGAITALVTGSLSSAAAGADIVVGVDRDAGSVLVVYNSAVGKTAPPVAIYPVGESITSIAIGDLDGDRYTDVAIVAGTRLMILHGAASTASISANRLEPVPLSFNAIAVAIGHFLLGGGPFQVAVLAADGEIRVLSPAPAGSLPRINTGSRTSRGTERGTGSIGGSWQAGVSQPWVIVGAILASPGGKFSAKLLASRFTGSPADDLIVADAANAQLTVLSGASTRGKSAHFGLGSVATLDAGSTVAAVLPMRLNVMGSTGLVVLTQDRFAPLDVSPQPNVTYHVTTTNDSQNGTCTGPSGSPLSSSCTTLRSAVIASNSSTGPNLIVFDVNGTVTLSVPGQDDNAQAGDLDVIDALTIVGNGTANTIIQGGPAAGAGIDKVFSFNPLGLQPGFAVSLTGLTIQFGTNTATDFSIGDNEGGAFDFDAGAQDGAGSLSVSNCNILQNSTLNGDGGAIALFDGGTVTISNTTIAGNKANTQDPNAWYGFYGGGIFAQDSGPFPVSITIANSSVSNNSLTATNGLAPVQFGGGICSFTSGDAIHGTTISGNQANGDGGGLYGPNGSFVVDQGSVFSNNVSSGFGGGISAASIIVNNTTLVSNTAALGGGALYSNGWAAAISNSRIADNSSAQGAPAVDGFTYPGATVTATGNWWGANSSPSSLVASGTVAFSPWLIATLLASPTTINGGGVSAVAASITTGSDGSSGYQAPDGTPVTFSGSLGTVIPAATTTASGVAASLYTAGGTAGTASATIDQQTLTVPVTIALPLGVAAFNVLWGTQSYNVMGSSRDRLPWQITGIQVVFTGAVATGNINSISGVTPTAFSGLGTDTLTWTISPMALGNFAVALSGTGANALADAAGNPLVGGAGFTQNLKVLWGDYNDDGMVTSGDMTLVNNARAAPYDIVADMNGDGVVNVADVTIVRTRLGTTLP